MDAEVISERFAEGSADPGALSAAKLAFLRCLAG
jgi:hypothetical protein